MKEKIEKIVVEAAQKAFEKGLLNSQDRPGMEMETPKHESHGDISTNYAMVSAAIQKMAPRQIADALIACMDKSDIIEKVEVAGPGFINFFLQDRAWHPVIQEIFHQDQHYGASSYGSGKKVQVEFVSANPTGPLHIGHARGAAVGDSVGNILSFCGFDVEKEYYINDSGRQINTLGRSVWLRLLELKGNPVDFPEDCYQGDYIKELALKIHESQEDQINLNDETATVDFCATFSAGRILEKIKADLDAFGVFFDRWFSEQSLYENRSVQNTIEKFRAAGTVYEKDGALWFRTTDFGDEKDRVVIRSNGETTYFASDIAYHMDKFNRGFERVIDVWGADHHGYIQRMKAAVNAQGRDSTRFDVILVQLVTLLRDGIPCAMSTRAGEFVTLRNIVDEVGKDAARFLFLSRSFEAHLDFDLEVAKQKNSSNPVYYVQYVHARISSIFSKAMEKGVIFKNEFQFDDDAVSAVKNLKEKEEIHILKILSLFPETVERSARTLHPHIIFTYLMTLASAFHAYYNKHKVITEHKELSLGRLCLVLAVKKVIRNGLSLLGVSAPERM